MPSLFWLGKTGVLIFFSLKQKQRFYNRYDLGNGTIYYPMIDTINSLAIATILFTNCIVLLRFCQVVIWKRVLEFDEDLLDFVITVTILSISMAISFVCKSGTLSDQVVADFSTSLKETTPFRSCADKLNPLEIK